mgnify:CR=1 FL=1
MTNEDSASPDKKPLRISPELASAIRELAEYMNTHPTLVCPFQEDMEAAQKTLPPASWARGRSFYACGYSEPCEISELEKEREFDSIAHS